MNKLAKSQNHLRIIYDNDRKTFDYIAQILKKETILLLRKKIKEKEYMNKAIEHIADSFSNESIKL